MGVIKFGVSDAVGAEAAGGNDYAGPVPPAGPYRGTLKRLELTRSKAGDPMLKGLIEVKETDKKKAKYNGYPIWFNQMVTDQGKGYVNLMLNSMAGSAEAGLKLQKLFWTKGIQTDGDGDGHVIRIGGSFKVNSPKAAIAVILGTKRGSYNGEERLELTRFLVAANTDASDDDDDEEDVDEDGDLDLDEEDDDDDGDLDTDDEDDDDDDADLDDDEELDEDGADDEDEDEDDVLRAELEALELKPLRLKARDEYSIPPSETKGKTESQIIDMIFDAAQAADEDLVDDESDLGQGDDTGNVTPIKKAKSKKEKPPF